MQAEVSYRSDNQGLEGELKFGYLNYNTALNGLALASRRHSPQNNTMVLQIRKWNLIN